MSYRHGQIQRGDRGPPWQIKLLYVFLEILVRTPGEAIGPCLLGRSARLSVESACDLRNHAPPPPTEFS